MKKFYVIVITAVVLSLPVPSRAMLELAVGAWSQNIDGNLSYNLFTNGSDKADVADDLDFEDDVRGVGYLKLELPILPSLYLGFTPMEFKGYNTMDRSFTFGRYTFLEDRPLKSKIELNHFDIGLYYSLIFDEFAYMKKIKVDLGLNLRTAELDVAVTGSVNTDNGEKRIRESEDYTLPIPMLYGAIQITPAKRFSLEIEGRGVTLGGDYLVSLLSKIKFRINETVFIAAGYRYDDIRLDEDDLDVDSSVSGLFFETGVAF